MKNNISVSSSRIVALVAVQTSLLASLSWATVTPVQPAAPAATGYAWVLDSVNLIPNSTFEGDTVGNTPAGWSASFGPVAAADAPSGGGSQSMELSSQAWLGSEVVTSVGGDRFFWIEVTLKRIAGAGNFIAMPGESTGATSEWDDGDSIPELNEAFRFVGATTDNGNTDKASQNSLAPGGLAYNFPSDTWVSYGFTFVTMDDGIGGNNIGIDDRHFNRLTLRLAEISGDQTYRVDNLLMSEFLEVGLPEPSTVMLLGLGAPSCGGGGAAAVAPLAAI